ncbi:MAG: N-6 DNA methylase [Planctomycetes bacterium]|nr:N-6 DNA methylase [Planctomycetota bacterium]
MHVVETYLVTLSEIHRTGGGTPETSYYAPLETLLNEVGGKLKPKVRAVAQLANTGAGQPDFGFYTANQFQRARDNRPIEGAPPERGVVEVKPWADDSFLTAEGRQVSKYWKKYGLVLVTNFRDFVLLGRDENAKPVRLETYRMAKSEKGFRALRAHPRKAANEQGDRLLDFLRRVLLYEAALTQPEDLAWFLASYAREARYRVEAAKDLPALAGFKKALEEALGMTFEGEKGEHFFQATLVQTLFYGVFSSWVLWSRDNGAQPKARFDWHNAAWTLHVPMIASLFNQIATPQKLRPLGVAEVLDWVGAALNRVDRPAFFDKFEEEHAVQYFYEPFLKAYDPELRKELGVWYTPPEIVQYQVERVDRALREELDIADGLADDNVIILDPCCGTGAYLVETLKRIHKTLEEKGGSALTAQKLKKAAMERVFGFEILPAPFVVSHLQLGLMLRRLGAPLDHDTNQRAGVYLTNALTGWEPLEDPKALLPFPELKEERDAANKVKQEAPILVILGNPPYNAFAGTSPEEEGGLVDVYKEGLTTPVKKGGWGIKKFNLDDLYVRFFRIAERRIAKSGKGIVCFISNFSYLGDPSFVVMRQRFLAEFDKLWFDCMNGDSRETGKKTPDGDPDPSVFSTEQTKVGIRVGTAICLMVRKEKRARTPTIRFQHYWGATKRQDVLDSLKLKHLNRKYEQTTQDRFNRHCFRPFVVTEEYKSWASVVHFAHAAPSNGLMEKRGGALMDIDRHALEERMKDYYDASLKWEDLKVRGISLAQDAARYGAKKCREKVLSIENYDDLRLMAYALRPFDTRWCYFSPVRPLWNEPRPAYSAQCWEGNSFFMTRFRSTAYREGNPCCVVNGLSDDHFITPDNACFPIRLRHDPQKVKTDPNQEDLFGNEEREPTITANLSDAARAYLAQLRIADPDASAETAGLIWMHALAIGYSPTYLEENADGIRQDWPRIPLPAKKKALLASARLGRRVAALLDTEKPVQGVTCGRIDPRLKNLGVIRKVGSGSLNPDAGELDMTVGWGHPGKDGVCMPGRGRVEERKAKNPKQQTLWGDKTLDIYLNDRGYWSDVPRAVWDYTIGGYQIIKKWLSYREMAMLGRGLKMEEADYVTEMVRRIAALILLQPELDANYAAVKADTWPWPL